MRKLYQALSSFGTKKNIKKKFRCTHKTNMCSTPYRYNSQLKAHEYPTILLGNNDNAIQIFDPKDKM